MSRSLFTFLIVLVCLPIGQNSYGQSQMPTEYEVMAAFLYNYTNFVKWPDSSFENKVEAFVIGIYGENPFEGSLSKMVKGEKVGGTHPIEVRQVTSVGALAECHIVFSSASDKKTLGRILDAMDGKSILTVGEAKDFAANGGMIGFVRDKGRVKFELNIKAANKADLRINSRLQRVAIRIVK